MDNDTAGNAMDNDTAGNAIDADVATVHPQAPTRQ